MQNLHLIIYFKQKYYKTHEHSHTIVDAEKVDQDDSEVSRAKKNSVAGSVKTDRTNKQLSTSVPRKRRLVKTSLLKYMESVEDQNTKLKDISQRKVENWLANNFACMGRDFSLAHELAISGRFENSDAMKFRRKQNITVSNTDDEDSLLSVDTAKYILSNRNKNKIMSKGRAKSNIRQLALASSRISNANLSVMNFNRNVPKASLIATHETRKVSGV